MNFIFYDEKSKTKSFNYNVELETLQFNYELLIKWKSLFLLVFAVHFIDFP
jgi:hypothetical protein